jgi:hypothetical protein
MDPLASEVAVMRIQSSPVQLSSSTVSQSPQVSVTSSMTLSKRNNLTFFVSIRGGFIIPPIPQEQVDIIRQRAG